MYLELSSQCPKTFGSTSHCRCAISYAREGKSPPGTKRLLTIISHVQENCSARDYKAKHNRQHGHFHLRFLRTIALFSFPFTRNSYAPCDNAHAQKRYANGNRHVVLIRVDSQLDRRRIGYGGFQGDFKGVIFGQYHLAGGIGEETVWYGGFLDIDLGIKRQAQHGNLSLSSTMISVTLP